MWSYKYLSVDQKVIFWSAIVTFLLTAFVFWTGAPFTAFSLMLFLIPWNFLARVFPTELAERPGVLLLVPSYIIALTLVLGIYWTLTRGIKIIYQAGPVELPAERLNKIKIVCAIIVNVLYFLFLYVFFPATPDMYP